MVEKTLYVKLFNTYSLHNNSFLWASSNANEDLNVRCDFVKGLINMIE